MGNRPYTDDELATAIACARSWRGVLRALGLHESSAGSARAARRQADSLGVDYSHFTAGRRWSDADLLAAIRDASSWSQVAHQLNLTSYGGNLAALRGHALRLGVSTAHLEARSPEPSTALALGPYRPEHLRNAGTLLAASWLTLRGARVAWPLEPCRYDLVADIDGRLQRMQVKTTTGRGDDAVVHISNSRGSRTVLYAPGEIDAFFVIDAELTAYLIPYPDVAGYGQLHLRRYANYRVLEKGRLISDAG